MLLMLFTLFWFILCHEVNGPDVNPILGKRASGGKLSIDNKSKIVKSILKSYDNCMRLSAKITLQFEINAPC